MENLPISFEEIPKAIGLMAYKLLEAIQYLVQAIDEPTYGAGTTYEDIMKAAKDQVGEARKELEKVRATYVIPQDVIGGAEGYLRLCENYIGDRNLKGLIGAARFAMQELSEHLS